MLATTGEELEAFRQNVDLQRKLGVEVYLLSPEEAKEIVPQLNVEDILGATYCPTDGCADAYSVVHGFASAARRLGVKILEDTEVVGIEIKGLYLACGFSRHGFMHSPAVGKRIAELILEGKPALDISPLALERFKIGSYQKEECFI